MKRKFVAMLCLVGVLAISGGCNSSESERAESVTKNTLDAEIDEETVMKDSSEAEIVADEIDVTEWGIKYKDAVIDENGTAMRYYINFPISTGKDRASGRIGFQDGYVLAIVAQRYNDAYDYGGNIENIFPTCFPQVIDIEEANQTSTAYDYAFDITNQELVEINGYQMCRYEGNHTYEFNHENYSHRYVAYATEVADGAYVFWMLIDESEDNSSFDLASEYALKMAYTLRTEE